MATREARTGKADPVGTVAALVADSLLPGDTGFAPADLLEAGRFLAQAARQRPSGQAVVQVEPLATEAAAHRQTRIAVVNDDMPFLVDSVANAISALGLSVDRLVHPVAHVERRADGELHSLARANGVPGPRESLIYAETARADARTRVRLRSALESTLADVRVAVADWPVMQEAIAADADRLDACGASEDAALLRWLGQDMLTQLAHVTRTRSGSRSECFGLCRGSEGGLLAAESYAKAFEWFEREPSRNLLIIKSNRVSQVHRRVPLDLFIVPRRDAGRITHLSVHAGVWTSAALAMPPAQVPRLREHLASLNAKFGFDARGHDGKALVHALTRLPHDVLVQFGPADLERLVTAMMSVIDRPRPRLVLLQAPLRRHVFAFVWLPRDLLSTEVRLGVAALLENAARARVIDWSLEVEGNSLASLRFVLDIRDGGPRINEADIDSELRVLVRGWSEALEVELAKDHEASRAAALAARYAEAFPLSFRRNSGPAEAARDVVRLRALARQGESRVAQRGARIFLPPDDEPGRLRLKLYQRSGAIELSDAVPMLENFGFRVSSESQTLLDGGRLGAIHEFAVELPPGGNVQESLARAGEIEGAVARVLNGAGEDDAFNRLIVAPGLATVEADWLRALFAYMRQAGSAFRISTAVDALQAAPQVAQGLIALFRARHDPRLDTDRKTAEKAAQTAITQGLAGVAAINDDRILRQYRAVTEAVLRTNAFVAGIADRDDTALAFKFDSALVPGLPRPVPWREIFVYSARVEGIHLRAGPVARGGLRWSDRRDDYRTEVLGLMKAQRVKNAVIVPTGAKGGFYPKRLPDPQRAEGGGRSAWLAEGRESYAIFVRSLLSLTDNISGRRVVHPRGMVIRDGEDPYFVVAADKGTATFSDLANAIAAESGFWLDDAFASGGSKGYDHKAMGITARGAWLSVQRHFMERGIDVQVDGVRVAGCGDMSGDVFGNGMLLSKAIRLVAAFDHRHIFLDPDPDPALSWRERKRLFALPRSSWDDYDKALISKGGGVFPRSQKAIPLSREVREALDIAEETMDPDGLISAILKAPVDLLWFGGIGTYVKAAQENNVQVGDPANDALRVDGAQIRASVIGEGANLGCTQAGRIEFALKGGRINTDFIDNSAGVDCSDNEVNIKIALSEAKREGALSESRRVRLLAAMTDEVSGLVLEDNRLQALALSVAEAGGAQATPAHVRLVEMLEERGFLDRRTEGIATPDSLIRRGGEGAGLTRPELAVLLSSAKLALQDALENSSVPDDPGLEAELLASFPARMRNPFRAQIASHRLRREIIATELANRIINRLGLIQPFELVEEEGATLAQVTAAFVASEKLFAMPALWREIEGAPMPEKARLLLLDRAAGALRPQIADLLRAGAGNMGMAVQVARLEKGIATLRAAAGDLLGNEARAHSQAIVREMTDAGAPAPLSARVAEIFELDGAVGIAELAVETGQAPRTLATAFIGIGGRLGLDWAQAAAARMNPSDPWERLLVAGVARDLQQMRLDFLRRLGKVGAGNGPWEDWATRHEGAIAQFRRMTERARLAPAVSPAMLAQLASHARNLLMR